jgi:hypothetical protein
MSKKNPPCSGDICSGCPNPDIIASRKTHFGKPAWEIECAHAEELHILGEGIEIICSKLNSPCCVDNNRDYFVNSPKISPLRNFFEASLRYLGKKN